MQLQDYFAAERKRFPATADIAYFMTASTGLIPDYVHEGISAYQEARYRRGGDSRWRDGEDSMAMMYRSKCQMADMLGCGPEDIAFAANTTLLPFSATMWKVTPAFGWMRLPLENFAGSEAFPSSWMRHRLPVHCR